MSGTVTNSLTKSAVDGAKITLEPAIDGVAIQTKADGTYSAALPIGAYKVTIAKDGFNSATLNVALAGGQAVKNDTALVPKANVVISAAAVTGTSAGAAVDIPATVTVLDGSTVSGYEWTQTAGVTAKIESGATATARVTLADAQAYKGLLLKSLQQLDRTLVQPINSGALATAQTATFKLTVTTSSGKYSGTVNVSVVMPFVTASGLANVPLNIPVLLHSKSAASYKWTVTGPKGSAAALSDATSQDPYFTPDAGGKYTLKEATTGASLDVYAGSWAGAITGSDAKNEPLAAGCTACHNGKAAPDNFATWKTTGHAVVFTSAISNAADHYAETCLACHTVGFDTLNAKNNGSNDQADFAALQSSGMLAHPAAGNWQAILAQQPKTAGLTNIQCENCHGPNGADTTLHPDGAFDSARISLASDVCGVCHGRPPSHSLFQQWQSSSHANYETASAEGTNTSCARCHTAQGFLTWIQQPDMTKSLTSDQMKALNLTASTAQPITCVVCHDPHDEGNLVANPSVVKVRIEGDTAMLPSGYQATDVGKGATCITCHNTRNGAHNDAIGPDLASPDRAPHAAAQGDVLLGENAYFVTTGIRGGHSFIEDTCATCHVELSSPPKPYTTSTNHGFSASAEICGDCHGEFKNGENLMASTEAQLEVLSARLGAYTLSKLPDSVMIVDSTPHTIGAKSYDVGSTATAVAKSNIKSLVPVEVHGRQGFTVTFATPVIFTYAPAGEDTHTQTLTTAQFQLGGLTKDGKTLAIAAADPLYRAGWNYWLVHGDSSKGVHNPSFVANVLKASLDVLK